jgi:hypothetical protein
MGQEKDRLVRKRDGSTPEKAVLEGQNAFGRVAFIVGVVGPPLTPVSQKEE